MSKKNKTPKEYVFRFQGSKEEFLYLLDQKASGKQLRYMGNYMIELIDDEIHFGVERGGHSGGYWFVLFQDQDGGKQVQSLPCPLESS